MPEPKIQEKTWSPAIELEMLRQWEEERPYGFDRNTTKPVFTIDTPPPYPSGTWHIGAVAGYSLIDIIARSRRMMGDEVLFPFGLDRNGINIELAVEKKLGKSLHDYDRAEFIEICRREIEPYAQSLLRLARRIGMSCSFDEYYYETDSPEYRRVTQAVFLDLWQRDLVYKGFRPAFYCPGCRTPIAEADVEYVERPTQLTTIRFPMKNGEELLIATTRPELLCACRAVIVHPDDERYQALVGKRAKVPIFDNEVPIRAHKAAKPEFGTGAAMICSYGDTTDIALFRELKLEAVKAIDEAGRMTIAAGPYAGQPVEDARRRIVEDLEAAGFVVKKETSLHKAPVCERSKTPIEFVPMEDWYLEQLKVLPELRKVADQMAFHPPHAKQLLFDWMDSVTIDWPISRRRYYHTEIPLWYCNACGQVYAPPPGKYYRPWAEPPPVDKCPHCGGTSFRGEERVFDTWMDSSNTNLVATLYLRDDAFAAANFPCSLRPQGRDIVRNWLYYTMLKSHHVRGRKPFEHVFVHGMGLDAHGRAMHKSLGNVIEPEPVIEAQGADAFRFWAASETNPGDDFRISVDRIVGAKKFLTKLWNVARFVSMFPRPESPGVLQPADKWILAELDDLVEASLAAYADFNAFVPANRVREFVWNLFAPHYLEMVKARAYEGDAAAQWTLHEVLRTVLLLLAPVTPFLADRLWRELYGPSLHGERFPQRREVERDLRTLTEPLVAFNSSVWKAKKERGLRLADELTDMVIPPTLEPFHDELVRLHRLQKTAPS